MATYIHSDAQSFPRIDYVWNAQLFVNKEVASKFTCQNCNDVPKQKCAFNDDQGHIYCEFCMEQLINDNNNNLNAINFTNSVLLDNLIGTLSIYCPHSRQAKYEYLINDETKIDNNNNDKYCKWNGKINDYLLNHMNKCDHIGISCPLQMIGCKADNLIQMDITKHFNNYNVQHLIIMAKQLNQCQERIEKFEKYMKETNEKMNALTQIIESKDKIINNINQDQVNQDQVNKIMLDMIYIFF